MLGVVGALMLRLVTSICCILKLEVSVENIGIIDPFPATKSLLGLASHFAIGNKMSRVPKSI